MLTLHLETQSHINTFPLHDAIPSSSTNHAPDYFVQPRVIVRAFVEFVLAGVTTNESDRDLEDLAALMGMSEFT